MLKIMFKIKIVFWWMKYYFRKKFKNRTELIKFQDKKLQKFASKILSKSVYYSKFFNSKKFEWNKVPIITKQEFMKYFDEINTVGIKKNEAMKIALESEKNRDFKSTIKGITIGLSTGTSGTRGLFLASENEKAKWTALIMNRVIKPNFKKKQKIAFFLRANSNLYSSVESSLFQFKYFDIFKPINELLIELNKFQPNILAAQPSVLIDIVIAQKSKGICINPSQIISFAEVLHIEDKSFIKTQFQCKFTEIYQCTEGFLGVSCEFETMHINEDFIRMEKEYIDENKFYPIITDFSRTSQPVVKYRLNDILICKKNQCKCGSQLMAIEKIIGRDDDVLEFLFENKKIKIYPDLICRRIALVIDVFFKYQIIQKSNVLLEIYIESDHLLFNDIKQKIEKELLQLFKEFGLNSVNLSFHNYIQNLKGNKNRKILKSL